jgi:2-dehydropantoate 2-reductase
MRYLIMGAGALGTVFGGLLQHSGQAVAFMGRGAHFEHLKSQGLSLDGIWGEFHPGPVATPQDSTASPETYDIILLCVKSFDTRAACCELRRRLVRFLEARPQPEPPSTLAEGDGKGLFPEGFG